MSLRKENGGAAFPSSGYQQWEPQGGMTLRDYFAAQFAAAQSVMTSADRDFITPDNRYPFADGPTMAEKIAHMAYALADAMLAERTK